MQDPQVGALLRQIRRRRGLRQRDVARLAGVSQGTVSLAERGLLDRLTLSTLRNVCGALEVTLLVVPRWRGGQAARLADSAHAAMVERVVAMLAAAGWTVLVEYTFSRFGERGSIDVLAWHPRHEAMLIVEVKSELGDLQDLLSTLGRKRRLAPGLLARERGWRARTVGCVVVLPPTTAARNSIRRHQATFRTALPDRGRAARRWVRDPSWPLAAVWFLSSSNTVRHMQVDRAPRRVRRPTRPG
jgi:transcriptional regulator with XRE-family HTH domain